MHSDDKHVPLSVFYIVKNADYKLEESLKSVSWADEIVIVDSGSTDRSVQIAEQCGAKVIHHEWEGYGRQKRFAEDQCSNPWVLNLDGDEVLSKELQHEIKNLSLHNDDIAFNMRWRDFWFTRMGHSKQRAKRRVRLYDRTKVRFRDHPSHDSVVVDKALVKKLDGFVIHYPFASLSHATEKINSYTDMTSSIRAKPPTTLELLTVFPMTFFKAYIFRRYFLCGMDGLVLSVVYAYQRFLRLAKTWERFAKEKQTENTA
ncbi:glycosyltransferase family 2 protein [Solemya velesiana gill symbiont]|uniref:Glycosyltransferase 2-like domain-containing protein n=1 Tax=Solemya velesiana gill symbiont TaxID=1918948 RepID=A0A1T2KXU9_9GAMM|nr:glycosyltransferase family 2 protein [Solemya velesiana gill symbiont]OOZ37675.1 hypothetical protein BOW51_01440 [Solemya velesiana gill symbiont]